MARARNIKPGFFTNDLLAEIDPLGRILFIGLWTIADREGRLEDRPRRIKAELLPYDDSDVDGLLVQLEKHGFILRYSIGENRFIQVLNFTRHQNPHVKESASTIPAPDEHGTSTVQEQNVPDENTADSLNPITDTGFLIPDSPNQRAPTRASSVQQRFDAFWAAYPKKVDKERARKAFSRIRWSEVEFADLLAALSQQAQSAQWTKDSGEFIPHPATWINNARWNVELPASTGPIPIDPDAIDLSPGRNLSNAELIALTRKGISDESRASNRSSGDPPLRMAETRDHPRNDPSIQLGAGRRTG